MNWIWYLELFIGCFISSMITTWLWKRHQKRPPKGQPDGYVYWNGSNPEKMQVVFKLNTDYDAFPYRRELIFYVQEKPDISNLFKQTNPDYTSQGV